MDICAPFAGIVHYHVAEGEHVNTGQQLASVEAIKIEAAVVAPGPGVVGPLGFADFSDVIGGDVLLSVQKA